MCVGGRVVRCGAVRCGGAMWISNRAERRVVGFITQNKMTGIHRGGERWNEQMGYGTHMDVWMPSVFSCSSTAGTPRGERSIDLNRVALFELVFCPVFHAVPFTSRPTSWL